MVAGCLKEQFGDGYYSAIRANDTLQAIAATVLHIISQIGPKEFYIPTLLRQRLRKCQGQNPEQRFYTVLDIQRKPQKQSVTLFFVTQALRPGKWRQ